MRVEQKQARRDKLDHDEALESFHGYVYEQLNSPRKDEILQRAAQRIQLWQRDKLCSSYYIRFWSSVVKAGDSETFKAKVLNASKQRSAAMMQNTPFSFLMRERS
ncbi:MAG: hypothetical protein RJB60_2550 [Pseudomonadota bacterium]|jgi:hypothetical protein